MTSERKTIEDLRAALFSTIDDVRSKKLNTDEARAISELAKQLIDTAKVEVDFMRLTEKKSAPFLQVSVDAGGERTTATGTVHSPEPGRTVHRLRGGDA